MPIAQIEVLTEIERLRGGDGAVIHGQACGRSIDDNDAAPVLIHRALIGNVLAGNPDREIGIAIAVEIARRQRAPEQVVGPWTPGHAPFVPKLPPGYAGRSRGEPVRRSVDDDDVAG